MKNWKDMSETERKAVMMYEPQEAIRWAKATLYREPGNEEALDLIQMLIEARNDRAIRL